METLGWYLRALRRARALTLGQLSLQAGVHKATLSRWETGTCWPRVPELLRVLDALATAPAERALALGLLDAPRAIVALRHADDPATLRVTLGDLLYSLRRRAGTTQADLARALGVSRSLIPQWENDDVLPSAAQRHATAFALGASGEEAAVLTTRSFAPTPLDRSRDALLDRYQHTMYWDAGVTPASYRLHLLSLLGGFGRLLRAGQADTADLGLVVSGFGTCALVWDNDPHAADRHYRRALALAAESYESVHFHMAQAVGALLDPEMDTRPLPDRMGDALAWRSRFPTVAGQAYLLSFVADALAEEAPDRALRLGERYCALVADDPEEWPCRQRDFGNLLRRCGRPAESVAFISALDPPDAYREGLKHLEIAQGLVALGATVEAGRSLADARRVLAGSETPYLQDQINRVEHAVHQGDSWRRSPPQPLWS